jgi:hypothetical protein
VPQGRKIGVMDGWAFHHEKHEENGELAKGKITAPETRGKTVP